eukprot:GHUV01035965.1.p1 GENE.GHUV01035965.1~~GHUV01035965.1.p1  ORF type:complete len:108 (+),score=27.09 GHUV01035965.1:229-552(+)
MPCTCCCLHSILQKAEADIARWQDEIPADQAAAEQLGTQLEEAERKLEQLQDGTKGEVEQYHQQLTKVWLEHSDLVPCSYHLPQRPYGTVSSVAQYTVPAHLPCVFV